MKYFVLLIIVSAQLGAQTIDFSGGLTSSKIEWKLGGWRLDTYNSYRLGYSVFGGVRYYDKRVFCLSSNIGLVQKGGEHTDRLSDSIGQSVGKRTITARLTYLSLNTIAVLKYPITQQVTPYIGFGPRVDLLLNHSRNDFDALEKSHDLNKISIGFVLQVGITYEIAKYEIGIKGGYNINLNKIADWPVAANNYGGSVIDKTRMINFVVGYKIR